MEGTDAADWDKNSFYPLCPDGLTSVIRAIRVTHLPCPIYP